MSVSMPNTCRADTFISGRPLTVALIADMKPLITEQGAEPHGDTRLWQDPNRRLPS